MKKVYLALIVLLTYVMVWLPFVAKWQIPAWGIDMSRGSMVLWQNYDGPNYLIIAKSWYNKTDILTKFSNPLPAEYYPAHFPLYPALIWIGDLFLTGPWSMLLLTLIGSVAAFLMFYKYVSELKLSKNAWWLTLAFLIFPARWLAVRSVGSPEPWFIFFVLASLFNFRKQKYWLAGLFGALAQLTKSPGILLFGAYGIVAILEWIKAKKINFKQAPLLLMPISLLGLFWLYQVRTGDFWAYFNSGDNIHLFWPPFSIFSPKGQYWVGNYWLEDVILTWLIFGMGILKLKNNKMLTEKIFALVFFVSTLFVSHRDISRYILPVAPFVLIGWDRLIQKREFKIIAGLLVIPIVLFTWNFLLNNTAPLADWAPYL